MAFSSRRRNYMLVSHRRDQFIEFIKSLLRHSFVLDALEESALNSWRHIEELIEEHRARADGSSRLSHAVPTVGLFHTSLPLARAWRRFDKRYKVSSRRFVSPSFNEIREILNAAQILAFEQQQHASSASSTPRRGDATPPAQDRTTTTTKNNYSSLSFVSFDGDCTLYSDGKNFGDVEIAAQIKRLLVAGVRVALVTAAGYGYDAPKYERRLESLVRYLEAAADVDAETLRRFFVVGGESNYLLQLDAADDADDDSRPPNTTKEDHRREKTACLVPRPDVWDRIVRFDDAAVDALLDVAEASIRESIEDLNLRDARVIRKPRAVGLLPQPPARRELLDETVLRAQDALRAFSRTTTPPPNPRDGGGTRIDAGGGASTKTNIPYCAFNGGSDVWCDIGNKRVGVQGLQQLFGLRPEECLHIGDQFLNTGNDYAARSISCCIWITNPDETKRVLDDLLEVVEQPPSSDDDSDDDDRDVFEADGLGSGVRRPGSPTVRADGRPRIFRARTSSESGILDPSP